MFEYCFSVRCRVLHTHTLNHDLKISPMSLVLSIGLTNAQFISPFHTNCTTIAARHRCRASHPCASPSDRGFAVSFK